MSQHPSDDEWISFALGQLSEEQAHKLRRQIADGTLPRAHPALRLVEDLKDDPPGLADIDVVAAVEAQIAREAAAPRGAAPAEVRALTKTPRRLVWVSGATAALMAAASIALVVWPTTPVVDAVAIDIGADPGPDPGVREKGGAGANQDTVGISVYATHHGKAPARVRNTLSREGLDALFFSTTYVPSAEEGAPRFERLMIFAVDAAGSVYWFHPQWTNVHDVPHAIPLPVGNDVELPTGVKHDLPLGPLAIVALYSVADLDVHAVEQAVAQLKKDRAMPPSEGSRLPISHAAEQHVQRVVSLQVVP